MHLQVIDPHTHQYMERMRDEVAFLALASKAAEYLERRGDTKNQARIALRRIEHFYIKTDDVYGAIQRIAAAQKEVVEEKPAEETEADMEQDPEVRSAHFSTLKGPPPPPPPPGFEVAIQSIAAARKMVMKDKPAVETEANMEQDPEVPSAHFAATTPSPTPSPMSMTNPQRLTYQSAVAQKLVMEERRLKLAWSMAGRVRFSTPTLCLGSFERGSHLCSFFSTVWDLMLFTPCS